MVSLKRHHFPTRCVGLVVASLFFSVVGVATAVAQSPEDSAGAETDLEHLTAEDHFKRGTA